MAKAQVRPEKLKEALNTKIAEAVFKLHELREADKPEMNRYLEPLGIAVAFVNAAHGVVPVAETFGDENPVLPGKFKAWHKRWKSSALLLPSELLLWEYMYDARRFQEHGEGAGFIAHQIEITRGDQIQHHHNVAMLALAASSSGHDNRSFKGGVRFEAYPSRPVSEVCADYLNLSQRFVRDFLRDHAHLIP
jgi:hypothetical protein